MSVVSVIQPGMLSSVQDLGRYGYESHGVPCGGAFDQVSHRLGNRLVGNDPGEASIEMTMVGGSFLVSDDLTVCLTGANAPDAAVHHGGTTKILMPNTPTRVAGGSEVRIGRLEQGARSYLCFAGGIQTHPVLGSRSALVSYPDAGLVSALVEGARLLIGTGMSCAALAGAENPGTVDQNRVIRIVPSTHCALFSEAQHHYITQHAFTVSNQSNRVGIRMTEQAFPGPLPDRVPSVGMVPGSIQIPPSGEPIVLGVDGPVSGGYPVIACVIESDLSVLAQRRPGSQVRFEWIDLETARQIRETRFAEGQVGP
ncbi:MAG: 5-oxoprolinase subunit C family protein [Phycisphaerales bacterium]